MRFPHPVGAGALYFAKSTRQFLYALRAPGTEAPNTWCCVGGGVEKDERLHTAVYRETQEELGVSIECPLFLLQAHRIIREGRTVYMYMNYLGIVDEPFDCVLNDEHTDYRWCYPGVIPAPLHPEFRKVLMEPRVKALLGCL